MSTLTRNTVSRKNIKTSNAKKAKIKSATEERTGPLFYFFVVVTALLIMAVIFGGTFFFVLRRNINGIGEQLRKDIQDIPLLRLALPKAPDPFDEKFMSESEVRKKYTEIRKELEVLQQELDTANNKITELEKNHHEAASFKAEGEKALKDAEAQMNLLQQKEKKLEEDRQKLNEMAAKADKKGYKEYYEQIEGEAAGRIYKEIIQEEKTSAEIQKFIKLYESMNPPDTARIFNQLGKEKLQLIVDILSYMKKETASEILGTMNPSLAADVTSKLAAQYLPAK